MNNAFLSYNCACRYYFVVTKNPGEQFYLFALLASYLIGKIGINFQKPEEYDDPNDTIEKILQVVRENVRILFLFNFQGSINRPRPSKVVSEIDSSNQMSISYQLFRVKTLEIIKFRTRHVQRQLKFNFLQLCNLVC
jgi:hypothetical protein